MQQDGNLLDRSCQVLGLVPQCSTVSAPAPPLRLRRKNAIRLVRLRHDASALTGHISPFQGEKRGNKAGGFYLGVSTFL